MGFILVVMNVCFFVAGLLLTIVAAYVAHALQEWSIYLPIALSVLGAFLCLVSILGGCAAYRKSKCMLFVFFIIVLVLVVAQSVFVIAALIKQDDVQNYLGKKYEKMDCKNRQSIESDAKCCGWNSTLTNDKSCPCGYTSPASKRDVLYATYESALTQRGGDEQSDPDEQLPASKDTLLDSMDPISVSGGGSGPFSLYEPLDSLSADAMDSALLLVNTNVTTCDQVIPNTIQNHLLLVGILGAILVCCQLVALVFSCCMCQEIRMVPKEGDEDMPLMSDARRYRDSERPRESDRYERKSEYSRNSKISAREDEYAF